MNRVRWGILSTGNIAAQFARGLAALPDAELVAVGSRTAQAAETFGATNNVPHRHASYQQLADDPDVDVIYVATPHTLHAENTIMCLEAGKAVLCEKPFAINAAQTEAMISTARQRGLFLMEAMWTRFLPHMVRLRELLAAGVIGEVRMLSANFGFRTDFDPQSRLFDPKLGGGALLDVGIYPISLASMILGTPSTIASHSQLGTTGVDEQSAMVFGYNQGQLAVLTCASRTKIVDEAYIYGSEGYMHIQPHWWKPSSITLVPAGQEEQQIAVECVGNGYNYEAQEVMRCLQAGETESPIMPLDETLALSRTLDTIRAQWGLRYPDE